MNIDHAGFNPAFRAVLKKRGFQTLDDLAGRTANELLLVRGISDRRLAEIERILALHGLSLRKSASA